MRGRAFKLTCVLTALAASLAHAQVRQRLVAWTDGPTPLGGDYRYTNVGEAGIDAAGRVVFTASASSPTRGSIDFVVRGRAEDLRVLARTGDPLPALLGASFGYIYGTLPLTFGDELAFAPYVTSVSPTERGAAVVVYDGDQFLRPVLWSEQDFGPAPGGSFVQGWFKRRHGGAHTSALIADLYSGTPAPQTAVIFGSPRVIHIAARVGTSLPGLNDGELVQSIDFNDFVMNAQGEAVFSITSTPPGGTMRTSLWKASVGHEASLLIRAGDSLPDDADWRVTYILQSSSNAQGDVAVAVRVARTTPSSSAGALLVGGPSRWTVAALTNRTAPGRTGLGDSPGAWTSIAVAAPGRPASLHLLDDGRVLFLGRVRVGNSDAGGFWMGSPSDVRLIAIDGELPIGGNGRPMNVSSTNRPMHTNSHGEVLLPAVIPGVFGATVAHVPGIGNVFLRATAWPIRATDGSLFTGLSDYASPNDLGSTGSDGRLSKLSNTGEFVANVINSNGFSGILVGRVACLADWNQDSGVTIDDLLYYLGRYEGGC